MVGSLFSYKLLSPRENLKRTLTNTGHTHGMNTCVLSAVEIWNKTVAPGNEYSVLVLDREWRSRTERGLSAGRDREITD